MSEFNEYRKTVHEAVENLIKQPTLDEKKQDNLVNHIMDSWMADVQRAGVHQKSSVDHNSATMTVTDTLPNSDQAIGKFGLKVGARNSIDYVAPRMEHGKPVTDIVSMAWDAGSEKPHITSVEQVSAMGSKKVMVETSRINTPPLGVYWHQQG